MVLRFSALFFLISITTTVYGMAKQIPPANVISKEEAQATALKAYAGEVKDSELQFEENIRGLS